MFHPFISNRLPALAAFPLAVAAIGLVAGAVCVKAQAADASHPAVVELFQSQGCSSCPPANANLNVLSQRADVLALSFSVTYWDNLGWKDTFASPQFTARQYEYAQAMHKGNVYTPQVVVNGRLAGVGADRGEMEALIGRAERATDGPSVSFGRDQVAMAPRRRSRNLPTSGWCVTIRARSRCRSCAAKMPARLCRIETSFVR
jgi:hypothetical protein